MDIELSCYNVRGFAKTSKLLDLSQIILNAKSSNNFMIMWQETKIGNMKEEQKKVLQVHKTY